MNGKIAFDTYRDGQSEIYVMNANGSNPINLTNHDGDDYDPVWSPDGTKIAFDSYRDDPSGSAEDVFVMNADGSGLIKLTDHPADDYLPLWSPDGKKIAFRSLRSGTYQVYVMNADGTNQVNVSRGHIVDFAAAWAPDSTKLLFTSFRDSTYELYVVNADGSGLANLTGNFCNNQDGAWSPDGSKIAFRSDRNGSDDIYVMNADGSNVVQLTNNTLSNFQPVWSPDGTKIAFWSLEPNGLGEVQIMNPDGTNQNQLTGTAPNTSGNYAPIWAPDSHKLLFRSRRDSNAELYVIDADASNEANLTNSAADEFDYDWQAAPLTISWTNDLQLGASTVTVTAGDNDEFIEPGESGALTVHLVNKGSGPATNIQATLSTVTPGVTVTNATSIYPNLAGGETGTDNPLFSFRLDENIPCGQKINFRLTVSYDGGAHSRSFDFTVQTGQPVDGSQEYNYVDAPASIPDNDSNGVNLPITVQSFNGFLGNLRFRIGGTSCADDPESVGIAHTWDSDLTIKLTSPQGTTVTLLDAAGGSGHNFCNLILDDAASRGSIQNVLSENAPFTGTFAPKENLAAFQGENPNGTWIVNVSDRSGGEVGTVRDVSLLLNGYACLRDILTPDLSLAMSAAPNPVEVETELSYTLTIANGQGASTGVHVSDPLPSDVTFVSATASTGSCSRAGVTVNCDLGNMRAYGLARVMIVVKPSHAGQLTNTASVSANESDPNTSNNSASVTTTVTSLADLVITNNDSPDPIPVGGSTTYTVTVTNRGPSRATNVVVTNRLDSGDIFEQELGDLGVNESRIVTVSGQGAAPGTISDEARVTANEVDPNPDNNVATQVTRVVTLYLFTVNRPEIPSCPTTIETYGRGTVSLNSAAPAEGAVITLTNSNPKVTVPPSVTIPAGGSSATFEIKANSVVDQPESGVITATFLDTSLTQPITVHPIYAHIGDIFAQPSGGQIGSAVALDCGESPTGVTVFLSSANPSVAWIDSPSDGVLNIPSGQRNGVFAVRVAPGNAGASVEISATANGHTETAHVIVRP